MTKINPYACSVFVGNTRIDIIEYWKKTEPQKENYIFLEDVKNKSTGTKLVMNVFKGSIILDGSKFKIIYHIFLSEGTPLTNEIVVECREVLYNLATLLKFGNVSCIKIKTHNNPKRDSGASKKEKSKSTPTPASYLSDNLDGGLV
jgi:hypothetical protein